MKLRKLAAALAAVFAVGAVLGAATATATEGTVLCHEKLTVCPPTKRYEAPTNLELNLKESTTNTFETSSGNVVCEKSSWAGTTESETELLTGKVSSLTFSGCKLGGTSCKTTTVHLPYTLKIKAIESGKGTVKFANGGSGAPGVTVECGPTINCTFTNESEMPFQGGKPALVSTEATKMNTSGLVCPSSVKWLATYGTSQPSGEVAPSKGWTTLCKKKEASCSAGETLPSGTEVQASASSGASLLLEESPSNTTVTCTGSGLEVKTQSEKGQGISVSVEALTFTGCKSSALGNPSCSALASNLVTGGEIKATSTADEGRLILTAPLITVKCGVGPECRFSSRVVLDLVGGEPATITASSEVMDGLGEALCATQMLWSASYSVSKPSPLHISG